MANAVVIKGMQELSRQFARVSKEVDGGCKKFMRRVTRQVAADAKARAPVGKGKLMEEESKAAGKDVISHYRDSIKYSMAKNGLYGWAYAGRKGDTKRGFIGHLLEYGTVKMAAIPHFLPALDKAKREFEPGLKAVIAAVKGGRL